ncbi:MAG: T9SS type A sorting domain-containing protein, partial [Nitrosopumilus sp.]|nr:T9SS type A sorting domain-containing protein [Nitrosopumilus sp.]
VHENTSIPDNFILHQNYPNPFNPKTIINYELGITNFISLKVYDALGNEIMTLTEGKKEVGSYSITFDGANLPSGIYFYKLEANNFSEVKRMIFLK